MKFTELGLHTSVMAGIEANHYIDCTPIQDAAILPIIAGHDIAGLAQTGTGKTAAFVIPLMDRIVRSREAMTALGAEITVEKRPDEEVSASQGDEKPKAVTVGDIEALNEEIAAQTTEPRPIFANWRKPNFVLVLVPTRELAEQVCENVARLGAAAGVRSAAIYGGTGYEGQRAALKEGVEFIVATPGRLIDLYKEKDVDLSQVRAVVFDEADRMFDMGFKDDMKYVLQRIPKDRQFLVFSATLNFDVLNTAYEFGANPVEVNVSRDQTKAENVVDEILHVGHTEKARFLLSLLRSRKPKQAIVFSNFKRNIPAIAKFLTNNGIPALGISSMISQSQRMRIMELFKAENDSNILVATDVAARGLDIKGVDMVINFELPDDAENYVHRIGRTGRAGANGTAISLVGDRDVEALQRIENYLGHKVTIGWIEEKELAVDFKPYYVESDRKDYGRRDGGPRQGGRDGGPRRGGRFGGGERQDRGSRPRHGGGEHRQSEGPRHGGAGHSGPRQEGPRHEGPRHEGPRHEGRPRHFDKRRHPDRDRGQEQNRSATAEGRAPHASGRPEGQRLEGQRGGGHGPRHEGKQQFRHGQKPAARQGQHADRKPHDKNAHPGHKKYGRKHTHRPGQTANAAPSVMTKVTGFLKNLFGTKQK